MAFNVDAGIIDDAFVRYYFQNATKASLAKELKHHVSVIRRFFTERHAFLSEWAKQNELPYVDKGKGHDTVYRFVVIDSKGKAVVYSNDYDRAFRQVLYLLERAGFDRKAYMAGILKRKTNSLDR
jgi:hypothetical protein